MNGLLQYYAVLWEGEVADGESVNVSEGLEYTMENLKACELYTVSVTTTNGNSGLGSETSEPAADQGRTEVEGEVRFNSYLGQQFVSCSLEINILLNRLSFFVHNIQLLQNWMLFSLWMVK